MSNLEFLSKLEQLLISRKKELPEKSYTTHLFNSGLDKILQKIGEESAEYIIDSKNQDRSRTIEEGADLFFHFLVSLVEQDIPFSEIMNELEKRHES